MSRELRTLSVPEGVEGERIDSALTRVLGLSRTSVVKLLEDGDINSGGRAMQKSDRVTAGQVIEVLLPAPLNQDPIPLTPLEGLTVVYNDDDIVVIDKPVGCAAHPSPGWMGPTVVGALMAAGYTISTSGPAERAGVVHRLDAGTSGLMIIAKTDAAYLKLKEMFRDHDVEKTYHALVQGHMDPSSGTIDAPIDRHPKEDHRFAVVATGKESITHYEVIEYYRSVSLVEVELETGRTHQIRVHFSALNHPLVGDTTYGADPVLGKKMKMSRPWLHALELRFNHPITGAPLELVAPYPPDLQASLALLSEAVLP
ncbi:MAG: RluA family pseudouridine synthase [Candidatus Planktophila sp.]|nr:RluA family pseudouridine synthase [Candidatus Planktophila sp.]MSO24625.1 RluA family pseudouridine synthase [Candidatus Planktophila sp.]PHX69997.1 MAG: RNA pseudouridine synthase [Actinomycetota bacterium]